MRKSIHSFARNECCCFVEQTRHRSEIRGEIDSQVRPFLITLDACCSLRNVTTNAFPQRGDSDRENVAFEIDDSPADGRRSRVASKKVLSLRALVIALKRAWFLSRSVVALFEKLMLEHAVYADRKNIQQELWRRVFYAEIEKFRLAINKVTRHPLFVLLACTVRIFSHSFVCCVSSRMQRRRTSLKNAEKSSIATWSI